MSTPSLPRFRVVLELTFRDADPMDPRGYGDLLERFCRRIEADPNCNCSEVVLRESLTISRKVDDYTDWRRERGEYNPSTWPADSTAKVGGVVKRKKPKRG